MEKEFIVYQSKLKQAGLSLLGIFMILVSFVVLLGGLIERQYLMIAIGVIGCSFFGFCEITLIKQVFKGKQLVILDSNGLYDYSSLLSSNELLIPWTNISKIENICVVQKNFVSIFLKNPEEFINNLSPLQRKAVKTNMKLGFGEINITLQSAKKCSNSQLIAQMNDFLSVFREDK